MLNSKPIGGCQHLLAWACWVHFYYDECTSIQVRLLADKIGPKYLRMRITCGWWLVSGCGGDGQSFVVGFARQPESNLDYDLAPVLIVYHYPSLASNILSEVCAVPPCVLGY